LITPSKYVSRLGPRGLAAVVFVLVFGGTLLAVSHLYGRSLAQQDAAVRRHAADLALAAAPLVDVALHETLVRAEQQDSEAYHRVRAPLVEFRHRHQSIQYLWTVRAFSGEEVGLVVQTATDPAVRQQQLALGRSQELLPMLQRTRVTEQGRHSLTVLRGGDTLVLPKIYSDGRGSYIEARAPLRDESGRFVGYVGVDYALDSYVQELNRVRWAGGVTLLLALVVSLLLARGAAEMRRETIAQRVRIEQAEAEMRAQRDVAAAASVAKSELLRIASHDLKNPLSAIAGMAGLMLKMKRGRAGAEADLSALEAIEGSARHMADIVRGILTNEGLESGGLEFRPQATDLVQVVRDVLLFNTPSAQRKQITLTADLPERLEATADPKLLREAFDNYLSNAVKYSPPGSTAVGVSIRRQASGVEFSVQDAGPGLNEADQAQLFQKFKKLSPRPTGGESSTGLGLSIVKTIAERHGGAVGCDTAPGRGARFWLRLPAAP
jgi:signal transduction histidine kinase